MNESEFFDEDSIPISINNNNNKNEIELINKKDENQIELKNINLNKFLKNFPKNNILITSDFFIDGYPPFLTNNNYTMFISKIHIILKKEKIDVDKIKVLYKKIPFSFLDDLIILHQEFSPIKYKNNFYQKFFKNKNKFAFGAFIKLNNKEYLIGFILFELCNENFFKRNVPNLLRKKNCLQNFLNIFYNQNEYFAYINDFGIINEFRRKNIGKELINKMINELNKNNIIAVFTHIIEHNISALKFFHKNEWQYSGVIFNFFKFNDDYYDGQVFCKFLRKNEEFIEKEYKGINEQKIDYDCFLIKIYKKIIKFIKT
jgi:ribosomal protein S18 acetylase RimI-like enzyme